MAKTYLFWEPLSDNILQERDESGALVAAYTAEPGLYGNVISQNRDGVESHFHFDAVGSTLAVTEGGQLIGDTFGYTAFGEVVERTGDLATPFQYRGVNGYARDPLTGEYCARARLVSPIICRWLAVDPLLYVDGTNRVPSW